MLRRLLRHLLRPRHAATPAPVRCIVTQDKRRHSPLRMCRTHRVTWSDMDHCPLLGHTPVNPSTPIRKARDLGVGRW